MNEANRGEVWEGVCCICGEPCATIFSDPQLGNANSILLCDACAQQVVNAEDAMSAVAH